MSHAPVKELVHLPEALGEPWERFVMLEINTSIRRLSANADVCGARLMYCPYTYKPNHDQTIANLIPSHLPPLAIATGDPTRPKYGHDYRW